MGLGESGGDAHDDIEDGDFDDWSIGVVLRVGLAGGKRDKYQLFKARSELERSRIAYVYAKRELENRLRTSLQKVSLLRDAVLKEMESVEINAQALEAEKQLLDAGKSKTIRLLEVEEDLLEAREELLHVRTLYRRGVVEMQLANARILEEYGVE